MQTRSEEENTVQSQKVNQNELELKKSNCNNCAAMLKRLRYQDMIPDTKYKLMTVDRKNKKKVVITYKGQWLRMTLPTDFQTMRLSPYNNIYLVRRKSEREGCLQLEWIVTKKQNSK